MTPREGPPQLRLFVAIELPDDVRAAIADVVAALKRAGADAGLRWARPDGIHLTLKFLGNVPEARVPAIVDAMRQQLQSASSFEIAPGGIGAFFTGKGDPFNKHPREVHRHNLRVLWLGAGRDNAPLLDAAARVEAALNPLGFPPERTAFFPHLTLARMREDASRETRIAAYDALAPYRPWEGGEHRDNGLPAVPPFRASSVALMQSTLRPGGAVYDAVAHIPLSPP